MRRIEILTALAVDAIKCGTLSADLNVIATAILRRACFDEDVDAGVRAALADGTPTQEYLETMRPLLAACFHELTPTLISALHLQVRL